MPSSFRKLFDALKTIPPSIIESERTFRVTNFIWSLGDQFALFKHIFQKEEQEENNWIENETLERIELLH